MFFGKILVMKKQVLFYSLHNFLADIDSLIAKKAKFVAIHLFFDIYKNKFLLSLHGYNLCKLIDKGKIFLILRSQKLLYQSTLNNLA